MYSRNTIIGKSKVNCALMHWRSRHTRSSDGPMSPPSAFSAASMSWKWAVSSKTASRTRKWLSFSNSIGFFQYCRSGWFKSVESISTANWNVVDSLLRQIKRENILINDLYNTFIYTKIQSILWVLLGSLYNSSGDARRSDGSACRSGGSGRRRGRNCV